MNLRNRKSKKLRIVLVFLLAWLLVACSGAENGTEPGALPAGSEETPPPPVAYGASLGEWSEAVATQDAAPAENDGANVSESSAPAATQSTVPAESGADAGSSNLPEPIAPVTITVTADPYAGALIETVAVADETPTGEATAAADIQFSGTGELVYQELFWDALVPAEYTPEAIMAKYADELAQVVDGSPEASELWVRMQEEFNNAPVNDALNGAFVKIPGFIAPLEFTGDKITEFLLVPYFGACIHVPPPPVNQTVLVRMQPGQGIDPAHSYLPIWVMGMITTEKSTTELAAAGYMMQDAFYEPYEPGS